MIEKDESSSGLPRLTCWTCEGTSIVKQPYMNSEDWVRAGEAFQREHGKFKLETFVISE